MTLQGKITHLLWGYNLVDYDGDIIRKRRFVEDYPQKAQKLIDEVYPEYAEIMPEGYNEEDDNSNKVFNFTKLNKQVQECIGFSLLRSRNSR